MIDAVFISDLHLHPNDDVIMTRFLGFIEWAALNTKTVYILGDLIHVWPGDEALDSWSESIAARFAWLSERGVALYFMPGNRDFLLGKRFMALAKLQLLNDPSKITLGSVDQSILLAHGDQYCKNDKKHQWLRRINRNRLFTTFFLKLPFAWRERLVTSVRQHSQSLRRRSLNDFDVVPAALLQDMKQFNVHVLVHGHTHKPGLTTHHDQSIAYQQYVLSDWDDEPLILCYDKSEGFYYTLVSR